jgi:predicted dehydrogenase/threonine dehydrogenase-like Zn-dependent dehydrogenase
MVKQIGQNYRTGRLSQEDVGYPSIQSGDVVVRTAYSVISVGTEGMKVREARLSYLGKARARPDQLRQVLDTLRQQGVKATYQKVMNRLDQLTPLGYSLSGYVVEVGDEAKEFRLGQRVAAAGAGVANHGEYNLVPRNLVVPVPEGVPMDHAAFGTIGAIAMHAFRQSEGALGEVALIIGLGLVGQILSRILGAAGLRAIGVDLVAERCALAIEGGAIAAGAPADLAWRNVLSLLTHGRGADVVFITAGSSENSILELAADMVRERGRIVVVGKTKLELDYNTFFRKEVQLAFSRSYGPGRYDPLYEHGGIDYPYSYVRWTERRNLEAFLDLIAARRIDLGPLVQAVRCFDDAVELYDEVHGGHLKAIGMLLDYGVRGPADEQPRRSIAVPRPALARPAVLGAIGAGNHASSMILPPLRADPRVEIRAIVTTTGLSAASAAKRFGARLHGTDRSAIFEDREIAGVVIATRHRSHAPLVAEALRAGKAVFVEKPLAIDAEGLAIVEAAVRETGNTRLVVGFNRRFAPIIVSMAKAFVRIAPLTLLYRVQAGPSPPDSWQCSPAEGGRFVGEAGHFFDVFQFFTGTRPTSVSARMLTLGRIGSDDRENLSVVVTYADGSVATLIYATKGAGALPKEYLEVHGGGVSGIMHNFWRLELFGLGRSTGKHRRFGGGKGHAEQMRAFVDMIEKGGAPPASFEVLSDTTRVTWLALEAAQSGETVYLA